MSDQPVPSLSGIESDIWQLLTEGSKNPKSAFYSGTLGTKTIDSISLRTVVVREVLPTEKSIICYSDKRAGKVEEIERYTQVSWLFWDDETKIQLRLSGTASAHLNDSLAAQHWLKTSASNRRSYMAMQAPGTLLDHPASGLPQGLDRRAPTQEESEQGRNNFAVIVSSIHSIDWLHLASEGHRRARFVFDEGKLSKASWIIP